jgi:hypothetical protein
MSEQDYEERLAILCGVFDTSWVRQDHQPILDPSSRIVYSRTPEHPRFKDTRIGDYRIIDINELSISELKTISSDIQTRIDEYQQSLCSGLSTSQYMMEQSILRLLNYQKEILRCYIWSRRRDEYDEIYFSR